MTTKPMIVIELEGPVVAMDRRMAITGNGKPYMYTPARAKHYQFDLKAKATRAMDGEPPLAGPIALYVWITCGIMQSWRKHKRVDAASGRLKPTGKPDVDNCLKTIQDALTGIVYADDSQIVMVNALKQYGDNVGVRISIEEIPE